MSVTVCGEDVEVTERFTYLGSDIQVSTCCEPEVNRRLGRVWGVMDLLDNGVWCCRYLCGGDISIDRDREIFVEIDGEIFV